MTSKIMSHAYYQLPSGTVACIDGECAFPDINQALTDPNGLIAIGGDLTLKRLLDAYRNGIYPWYSENDPILWWSPNPRMVLYPAELKVTNSLKKTLKNSAIEIRFNSAFREVITACKDTPRHGQTGTWITPAIVDGYCALHDAGYAVSAEAWLEDKLVGGCYGVKIGKMFYGESMFHHVRDASKMAFVTLVQCLEKEGVGMIDCQMKTAHLASLGAKEIPRHAFITQLEQLCLS